jgi:hypothetical protein
MLFGLWVLVGCDGSEPASGACAREARPAALPVAGDANGDGVFDIADVAAIEDEQFRAGDAVTCAAAGDMSQDGVLDVGDGAALLYALFTGTTAGPTLADGACARTERTSAPACGDGLAWGFTGETRVTGTDSVANPVTLTLTTVSLAVQAWSASVRATGCTIAGASVAGTASADVRDTPPGLRDGGFTRFDVTDAGIAGGVLMQLATDAALPPSSSAVPVLTLDVRAPVGGSCGTCTVTLEDGQTGPGLPVQNVVSAGGYAYTPEAVSFAFEACP